MQRDDVDRWLQAYVEAWKRTTPSGSPALFSREVSCRYHPYDEPLRGRDAVVSWLGEGKHAGASTRDQPGTYDATYRTIAIDGDTAIATGSSRYSAGRTTNRLFDNCFVIRFDASGRCGEFTEWDIERPHPPGADT